jgi:hypothetical protein
MSLSYSLQDLILKKHSDRGYDSTGYCEARYG